MQLIRSRMGRALVGAGAALALALPMAAQADAATVRLHAATATGESLRGPSFFGTSVSLTPTNVNASNQKWVKTDVGGGFATYRSLAGTNQPMCLAASVGNPGRSLRSATRAASRSSGRAASSTTAGSRTAARSPR